MGAGSRELRFDGGDPLRFLERAASLGDIVPLWWDEARVFLLNRPGDVEEALLEKGRQLTRSGGPRRLARLLGDGLLRSQGEKHLRQRRLTQPAFHPKWLASYGACMAEEAARRFARARAGAVRDLHRDMTALTLAVVARTFFSMDWSARVDGIGRDVSIAIRSLPPAKRRLPEWWRRRRFERACGRLDEVVHGVIRERRARPLEASDLLDVLAGARDEDGDGSGMTDEQLRDELMTLIIAGHETTASALTWAGYLLAADPAAQERVRDEVAAGKGSLDPTRLPYSRGVFAEALRLYPPAWILFRRALEDVEVGGVPIARGAHLALSPYTMGRDARLFPEPERFQPERWLPGNESRVPKGAFFAFGLGNRRCVGESFAWAEGTIVTAALCRDWEIERASARPIPAHPLFTLRPKRGMPIRFVKRRSP